MEGYDCRLYTFRLTLYAGSVLPKNGEFTAIVIDLAIVSIQGTPQQEAEWRSLGGPLWLSNQEADAAVRSNTNHRKQELKPFVETLFKNYKINL